MRTLLQVLSEEEQAQIHERTLTLLAESGMRVDTARGRHILGESGAIINEHDAIVLFPPAVVETALQSAPRQFSLGGRRPNWGYQVNAGNCTLLADGEAIYMYDAKTGTRRVGTYDDWLHATLLIDAMDEVGLYWSMIRGWSDQDSPGDFVNYWCNIFRHFTKHVQDVVERPGQVRWLLEVLQVIIGGRETIRREKPVSLLLTPYSPRVIEEAFTTAYLETLGWDIPVAVMPMPMMGTTAPGSLISTLVLANSEVLATLCFIQAAAPGTPFIYAPAPSIIDPRTGRFGGGAIEHALLGAAVTEMGRYYGLPVLASTGGADHHIPDIQAGYERGSNWALTTLSWPDILVGPGLLGGAMTLSLEQLLIDVEIFRRCKRLYQGIGSDEHQWLENTITKVGPGGNFLAQPSTRKAVHSGEWYIDQIGMHTSFEAWEGAGKPSMLDSLRDQIDKILDSHTALPFGEDVERELEKIEQRAREEST